jgi:hypothetical protein
MHGNILVTSLLRAQDIIHVENVVAVLVVIAIILDALARLCEDSSGVPRRLVLEFGIANSVRSRQVARQGLEGLHRRVSAGERSGSGNGKVTTHADEASLGISSSKGRLVVGLGPQLGNSPDLLELGHRALGELHLRDGSTRRLGIGREGHIVGRYGRGGVAVLGGVGGDGWQLLALLSTGEVGALRVFAGLGGRLSLLGRAPVRRRLWCVGGGRREGVHGRVSLGSNGGLLRRMQRAAARAARGMGLVMRPHGILDASICVLSVLHGDVAVADAVGYAVAVAVAQLGANDGRCGRVGGCSSCIDGSTAERVLLEVVAARQRWSSSSCVARASRGGGLLGVVVLGMLLMMLLLGLRRRRLLLLVLFVLSLLRLRRRWLADQIARNMLMLSVAVESSRSAGRVGVRLVLLLLLLLLLLLPLGLHDWAAGALPYLCMVRPSAYRLAGAKSVTREGCVVSRHSDTTDGAPSKMRDCVGRSIRLLLLLLLLMLLLLSGLQL